MKKLAIITSLMLAVVASHGQGVINFSSAGAGVNAKFQTSSESLNPAGTTLLRSIHGTFRADFFYAPGSSTVGVNASSLVGAGFNQGFTTSATAAQYGFFSGGSKTLATVAGGTSLVGQVRVWDTAFGATYDVAKATAGGQWFESPLFVITPTVSPSPVPNLVGLGNGVTYTLNYNPVPEPSSMALAGLGAAALLVFRRRK